MLKAKAKVFVGMSGGVDSSVSAALLKKAGYDVTGVFIKVWQPDWIECNWKDERIEAMRAAAHLDIPFVTLDLVNDYKKGVIDYMIEEYKSGRTPNPDVMCNREVKFGAFWKWSKDKGADFIATGHYAQNIGNELHVSKDTDKDQTYFLWTLTKDDLNHTLFPVGHMTKSEVRRIAKKFKLPNADKKDSQGLCFIGKVDVKEFLSHYIKPERGDVLDENGNIVGFHDGSAFLTIGERHGFTVTKKTPDDLPNYIIAKDSHKNTITVSPRHKDSGHQEGEKRIIIRNTSWINSQPKNNILLKCRSRYREMLCNCTLLNTDNSSAELAVKGNLLTFAPGQSLVIYDGPKCLGGGIIV